MAEIILATLNGKWIHAAFGLRYLRANLGELRGRSAIMEFDLTRRPTDIAESLLLPAPKIVGLGVYVWNAAPMLELVSVLKRVAPEVCVVIGGPEVSHETDLQPICQLADYVVRGEADLAFAELCRRLLAGERPPDRVIDAELPHFEALQLPYDEYTDDDIAHRLVYVEASRGCPFTCEFCLSSLDVPVRQAPLESFLQQLQRLHQRGVRHFKFVDRTFNLNLQVARAILGCFAALPQDGLLLHFEMVPDRLPDGLRDLIAGFAPGVLQFEVGIQTFDAEVARRIARRQDVDRLEDNLRWLRAHSGVHVHADLIVGLPGEDLPGFGRGFDRLWALGPQEIQVGILKRLRGAPIARHDAEWQVQWSPAPPYEVLQTRALSFVELQRLKRFARYWDLIGNSGNFATALRLLLAGSSPFAQFLQFSDWLHAEIAATHGIALHRLAGLLWRFLLETRGQTAAAVGAAMAEDYRRCARHDWPEFLRPFARGEDLQKARPAAPHGARQARHLG